LLIKI